MLAAQIGSTAWRICAENVIAFPPYAVSAPPGSRLIRTAALDFCKQKNHSLPNGKKWLYVPYAIGTYLAKRGCHFPTLVQTRSGSKGLEVLLRSQLFGGQSSAGKAPLVVKKNIQFICCCSYRIIISSEVNSLLDQIAFYQVPTAKQKRLSRWGSLFCK